MGAEDAFRVLIADADAALRQQLFTALLAVDVFSDCVSTVADAISRLGGEAYSVVVLDVGLPGGDVEDVVSRIAALPVRPVVLVLGSPEAARSLDVEIVQIVLRRPVKLTHIVDLVRSCVKSVGVRTTTNPPRDQLTS